MREKVVKQMVMLVTICVLIGLSVSVIQAASMPKVKVQLNKSKVTLYTGKTIRLSAKVTAKKGVSKKVKWSSSNSKVAKVSNSGQVKALKAGSAIIKATSTAEKKVIAKCQITVNIDESKNLKVNLLKIPHYVFENVKQRKVSTYEEMQELIEEVEKCEKHVKEEAVYSFDIKNFDKLLENMKQYDEIYFQKNNLYISNHLNSQSPLLIDRVERVKKTDGKMLLRIILTNKYAMADVIYYPSFFVITETPKSYDSKIDQVKVQFKINKEAMSYK